MKYYLLILSVLICSALFSQVEQEELQGNVSYVGSANVYVTFVSTEGLKVGDSLFISKENKRLPVLIINHLSSISCVGTPIGTNVLMVSHKVLAKKRTNKPIEVFTQQEKDAVAVNDAVINAVKKMEVNHDFDSRMTGRFSVSSYNNSAQIASKSSGNNRLRYNLEFNAEHISNSKLSFESYLSFTHKLNDSTEKYDGLRIYDMALKYELDSTAVLTAGRKINSNMANVGAVDGVQFEKTLKHLSYGAILGTRPNDINYGFDPKLLQVGAFIGHHFQNQQGGGMQSSFAVFNQTNNLKTDRRYVYFQHSNTLLKNVDLFCSFEADLYKLDRMLKPVSTFDLTSTYASIRYKPWKQLSMALTYDVRNNIYYYETYKKLLDSIFDKATRQGLKFQTTVRPIKNLTWGTTVGYRSNPKDTVLSYTGYSYLTYTNLPFINSSATISATGLKTQNTEGVVYGFSLSRDFLNAKLFAELQYKYVDYAYSKTALQIPVPSSLQLNYTQQNVAELSLNWRLTKKLMLSADFEATFEKENRYGRLFINVSQRF